MVPRGQYFVLVIIIFLTPHSAWTHCRHSNIYWMTNNNDENSNNSDSNNLFRFSMCLTHESIALSDMNFDW